LAVLTLFRFATQGLKKIRYIDSNSVFDTHILSLVLYFERMYRSGQVTHRLRRSNGFISFVIMFLKHERTIKPTSWKKNPPHHRSKYCGGTIGAFGGDVPSGAKPDRRAQTLRSGQIEMIESLGNFAYFTSRLNSYSFNLFLVAMKFTVMLGK
jgi:hypothetical protein